MKQFRIHKNDVVKVIAGTDKDRVGRVLKVLRKSDKIVVEKVNVRVRHTRPNPQAQHPGGKIEKEMPIHISNVLVQCPKCHKATRVGCRYIETTAKGGETVSKKVRFCKQCNEILAQGGKKK